MATDSSSNARVIADYGAEYLVDAGGSTRRACARGCDPVVGDRVVLSGDVIVEVLPRTSVFSRRAAGRETAEQVLAANVDVAFIVASAIDLNERRLERYLTIAWQSGASPVVVVTKSDLVATIDPIAVPAPVIVTSSLTGAGIDDIARELRPARTGVLLGPSGAGKSSLVNRLLGGDVAPTRKVHRSGEGRHMTSHRRLFHLPGGGMIIDTPGLREAQLWGGDDALGDVFEDVESLASMCRFNDCSHETEPGCAVKSALGDGTLDAARLRSYRKLRRELLAVARKSDARLRIDERRRWRRITLANRERENHLRR